MTDTPAVSLRTGASMPQVGFGTYKVTEDAQKIVESALETGYRHIDTAQMYGNEPSVGKAWTGSGLSRGELFITSKLDNPNHREPEFTRSFHQTLEDLQTDYVDLFLIHWPLPMRYGGDFETTWKMMEGLYESGAAKAIGLSNFEPEHIERIVQAGTIVPHVIQVESHPFFHNSDVRQTAAKHGILFQAWSPLARSQVVGDETLQKIADRYGKSAAQVALRWGIQRGHVVLPKSSTRARQIENRDIFDFELNEDDMGLISSLNRGEAGRTGGHPLKRT